MPLDPAALVPELPGLLRYARALTRDDDAAADLVQDTALRALERSQSFRGESSVATWLHRIMHHRFVDLTRARHPVPTADDALVAEVETAWQDDAYTIDAEVVLARAQTRDELWNALSHLPVILRSAVILHDMEGWTNAEIATVHDIGLPAAKQRLRRGRALLITMLADDEDRRTALRGVPMQCWQARAMIGDYLDDELPPSQRGRLERHLAGCPTCPGLFSGVVGIIDAVGRLRDPETVIAPELIVRLRGQGANGAAQSPVTTSPPSACQARMPPDKS
ncbi:MAG: sigma-70 family RNA polymerase sigma factor [Phycicoccus sp.]|nr:sigma-70 family RNA polymerase sigma factor [Phycicoccus sp.]